MNTSTTPPNIIVLNAFNRKHQAALAITDLAEQKRQTLLLVNGSQSGARIVGLFNAWRVQEMISRLKSFLSKRTIENDRVVYRFNLPSSYTAFSPLVRLDELYDNWHTYHAGKGDNVENGMLIEIRATGEPGNLTYKLHASRVPPLKTTIVSFVLNKEETELEEWFAGDYPYPTATHTLEAINGQNLGAQWVRLGVYVRKKDGNGNKKGGEKSRGPKPLSSVADALETATATSKGTAPVAPSLTADLGVAETTTVVAAAPVEAAAS